MQSPARLFALKQDLQAPEESVKLNAFCKILM
uniref:Uncharacterized protein n=1 Tax=Arundo donax TaxID=35708 RepID=A0A0A9AZB4_ARUDO